MQPYVEVIVLLALLGLELTARPESYLLGWIGACWLLLRLLLDARGRPLHAAYLAGSILFAGWLVIYYLNPTHIMEGALGLMPVEHRSWLPGSAYPAATREVIPFAIMLLVAGGLALRMTSAGVRILFAVLMVIGLAMAVLTIEQRLAPNPYQIFPRTGWFTYENHYAAFTNLILPLFLATGLRIQHRATLRRQAVSAGPFFYLLAMVLLFSVYLSRSRAGLVISLLIIALYAGFQMVMMIRRDGLWGFHIYFAKTRRVVAFGLLAGLFAAGSWLLSALWGSGHQFGRELAFRGQIIVDALSVVRDHPLYGTGPGTFMAVFPYYQSPVLDGKLINHAHCDPVEFLVEYGIAGVMGLAFLVSVVMRLRSTATETRVSAHSFGEIEIAALALGVGGLILHSLVDFSWRSGPTALLGVVYAGLCAGVAGQESRA